MDAISYTAARANLAKTMQKVCDDHEPVIITRQNADPVIMMSLADYHSMEETNYLLQSPENAARLMKAVADIEAGRVVERELLE